MALSSCCVRHSCWRLRHSRHHASLRNSSDCCSARRRPADVGRLVRGLGCAGDVIPYRELTAERLAGAIVATLGNSELRKHTADFALKIQAEQGLSRARTLIEQLLCNLSSGFIHDDKAANMRKTLQQRLRARKTQPDTLQA